MAVLVWIVWTFKMSWLLSIKKGPALFSLSWAPVSLGWVVPVAAESLQHREFNSKSMKTNTITLTKFLLEQFFITNSVCRNTFFSLYLQCLKFKIAFFFRPSDSQIYFWKDWKKYITLIGIFVTWNEAYLIFFVHYFTLHSFMVMTGKFSSFCHFVISWNQMQSGQFHWIENFFAVEDLWARMKHKQNCNGLP